MKGTRAFTLVEMIVVLAIIGMIIVATAGGYSFFVRRAQQARGEEQVYQVRVALENVYNSMDRNWPPPLLVAHEGDHKLDHKAGAALAKKGAMDLAYRKNRRDDGTFEYVLTDHDRFGVLSPWAMDHIKRTGEQVTLSTKIPTGGTVADHILRVAVDDDGDGKIEVNSPEVGKPVTVRGKAACVWCCGRDGKFNTADDIHSWQKGDEVTK